MQHSHSFATCAQAPCPRGGTRRMTPPSAAACLLPRAALGAQRKTGDGGPDPCRPTPRRAGAMAVSFEAVDQRLEAAAATLGAGALRRFLTITLPLAVPGMIAGAVLAFARALGEFGATITFVSNIPGETQTISAAIYSFLQTPGGDLAALRLAIIAGAIALMALVVSELLQRRAVARVSGLAWLRSTSNF